MPEATPNLDMDAGLFILGGRVGTTSLLATSYKWPDCTLRIDTRFLTLKTPQASWSILRSDVQSVSFMERGLIINHNSPQAPNYVFLVTLDHRLIEKKLRALDYPIKAIQIQVPDRSLSQLFSRFVPIYITALGGWYIVIDRDYERGFRALIGISMLTILTLFYVLCRTFYPTNSIKNYSNPDLIRRIIFSTVGIVMTMNIIYIHSHDRLPFYTEYEQRRIAGLAAQAYLARSPDGLVSKAMAQKLFEPKIFTRIQGEVDAKLMELKLNHLHTDAEVRSVHLVDSQGMTVGVVTGVYNVKGININNPFQTQRPFTFQVLFGPAPDHDEEIADYHIDIQ